VTQTGSDPKDELLRPWPRLTASGMVVIILLMAVYTWSFAGTEASPAELVRGMPDLGQYILRMFPPQYDMSQLEVGALAIPYPSVLVAILETIQMAIVGTTLGVLLSLPFALLAARNTTPHWSVYLATRMLLNIDRAVPELVIALIFVAAVGLGPFGGTMAIAVGAIGSLGKLFAESVESIDPKPVMAVRATGASGLLAFQYGVMPQALPVMASYSLLAFESNVRTATILGMVGAGGIGFELHKYASLFQNQELCGAILILIAVVTVIDRVTDRIRKRII